MTKKFEMPKNIALKLVDATTDQNKLNVHFY